MWCNYKINYLFVISIEGLNEPFKRNHKSLLDYMSDTDLEHQKLYFRNFLVIALDLFSGLQYFKERNLVHRDVKRMWNFCTYITLYNFRCIRFKHTTETYM